MARARHTDSYDNSLPICLQGCGTIGISRKRTAPGENAVPDKKPARSIRSKLFGWWYVAIGAGFLLLSINRILVGGSSWLIALRLLISAGFFLLGYLELRSKLR